MNRIRKLALPLGMLVLAALACGGPPLTPTPTTVPPTATPRPPATERPATATIEERDVTLTPTFTPRLTSTPSPTNTRRPTATRTKAPVPTRTPAPAIIQPTNTLGVPPPAGGGYVCGDGSACIKGNISSSGEKIYHFPGCASYNATKIDESKGERWFVTSADAEAAGWRRAKNCPS